MATASNTCLVYGSFVSTLRCNMASKEQKNPSSVWLTDFAHCRSCSCDSVGSISASSTSQVSKLITVSVELSDSDTSWRCKYLFAHSASWNR